MIKKYISLLVLSFSLIPLSAFADFHTMWKTILYVKNDTHSECQITQINTDHDEFDRALLEKPIEPGSSIKTRLKQRKKSKPETINNSITYQCGKQAITLEFNKERYYEAKGNTRIYKYKISSLKVLSHDTGINAESNEHWKPFSGNYVSFRIFNET